VCERWRPSFLGAFTMPAAGPDRQGRQCHRRVSDTNRGSVTAGRRDGPQTLEFALYPANRANCPICEPGVTARHRNPAAAPGRHRGCERGRPTHAFAVPAREQAARVTTTEPQCSAAERDRDRATVSGRNSPLVWIGELGSGNVERTQGRGRLQPGASTHVEVSEATQDRANTAAQRKRGHETEVDVPGWSRPQPVRGVPSAQRPPHTTSTRSNSERTSDLLY
jgi:hypothetical protein